MESEVVVTGVVVVTDFALVELVTVALDFE